MKRNRKTAHTILQGQLCFLCLLAACEAIAQTRVDYSRFSHVNENHTLDCDTCHKFPSPNWKLVRKESDAFPDISEYPDHQSCIECHRPQFFARERPAPRICANCHVKASPRDTSRFPFPTLREPFLKSAKGKDFVSEFKVMFPVEKHQDVECDGCQTASPSRNHSVCFTCHNQESELAPLPQSCGSCHQAALPKSSTQ